VPTTEITTGTLALIIKANLS